MGAHGAVDLLGRERMCPGLRMSVVARWGWWVAGLVQFCFAAVVCGPAVAILVLAALVFVQFFAVQQRAIVNAMRVVSRPAPPARPRSGSWDDCHDDDDDERRGFLA